MTYVYLLSDYDEHGSDNVHATTNREDVLPMFERLTATDLSDAPIWVKTEQQKEAYLARVANYRAEAVATLTELLTQPDEVLAEQQKHGLLSGWGGHQLHVVKLEGTE